MNGNRGCYLVVNVEDPSQIPSIAEPFLLSFNASMEIIPVFGAEDLEKAGESLGEVVRKYG